MVSKCCFDFWVRPDSAKVGGNWSCYDFPSSVPFRTPYSWVAQVKQSIFPICCLLPDLLDLFVASPVPLPLGISLRLSLVSSLVIFLVHSLVTSWPWWPQLQINIKDFQTKIPNGRHQTKDPKRDPTRQVPNGRPHTSETSQANGPTRYISSETSQRVITHEQSQARRPHEWFQTDLKRNFETNNPSERPKDRQQTNIKYDVTTA